MRLTVIYQVIVCISLLAIACEGQTIPKAYEDKLVIAIWKEEGGTNTRFPYGVEWHGKPLGCVEAEKVCRTTIEHSWTRWCNQGSKGDFISWLGRTYAADPLWAVKVRRLMECGVRWTPDGEPAA